MYLYGPEVRRRHDITLYRDSGLDETLEQHAVIEGDQFYVYADAAFIMRPWLQISFNIAVATVEQIAFNTARSAAREAVEWGFKDVKQQFTSNDFSRMLKVRKSPIPLMYKMSILLWNLKVCLHGGGQVGIYFNCDPPSLEDYLFPITED